MSNQYALEDIVQYSQIAIANESHHKATCDDFVRHRETGATIVYV